MKTTGSFWLWSILILMASLALAQPPQEQNVEIKIQDSFAVAAPARWRISSQTRDSAQIYVPRLKEKSATQADRSEKNPKPAFVIASEAGMLITVEHRKDHAEALRRLAEIASEYPEQATILVIGGWPAMEKRYRSLMPQPADSEESRGNVETWFSTTAVAIGTSVIRFDTMLAPDADLKLLDEAMSIVRAIRGPRGPAGESEKELDQVRRMIKLPRPRSQSQTPGPERDLSKPRGGTEKEPGVAVQVQTGLGELEVATNDGKHVVVAANSGFSFSDTFGSAFVFGGGTPCTQAACDGDPSLAVGKSTNIYYSWIGGPTGATLGDGVSRSTDNGHTFVFRGMAATCPGTTMCTLADQEHIAADRSNAASGGGDRVYSVWRDFAPVFSIRIACSADSGTTWTAGTPIGAGDLPRVSVGGDGFVYAAWPSGANMMFHKFSSCDAGLVPQLGWPITVSAFTNVVCPMPGLDRCNGRNILSSQKVAVDDLDPTHIYYAFATSTGAGNEDIMVFDSTDGGATFPRSVRVNAAVPGRRFMPWISTYGGIAVLSWYDRRNATAGNNDLTRFFIGGAAVRGISLVALSETDLSGVNDAQCSNWLCATNATTDSESCSTQPQLAGRCSVSGAACDFSTPACSVGETCNIGRGCPKYGDYNGNAAGGGIHYSAWSSATPPVNIGGGPGSIRIFSSADRIPSDFYVRDWNQTLTTFDNGAQPSTNPVFWATSDVWNQNTTTAAAPGPDGSVVGDPPSRAESNFVFARVSRRAAAMSTAPAAPVTANFFFGDYGLGSPFVAIGSETVTFSPADMMKITPAHSWTVPVGASSHLCLAVQIDGPDGDTFALPSVAGIAPGPADPLITSDNNKAQRNLQDTIGTASGTELIAIIRNAEKVKRVMQLQVKLPPGVRIAGTLNVIGGEKFDIRDGGKITIGELAPDERRWLRFHAANLKGVDRPTPIDIFEATDPPANGFTILLHRASFEDVARRRLVDFAGVFGRLARIEKSEDAGELAKEAQESARKVTGLRFTDFLSDNRNEIQEVLSRHLKKSKDADQFEIGAAASELWNAVKSNNQDLAATFLGAVTERLDAHLTMQQYMK